MTAKQWSMIKMRLIFFVVACVVQCVQLVYVSEACAQVVLDKEEGGPHRQEVYEVKQEPVEQARALINVATHKASAIKGAARVESIDPVLKARERVAHSMLEAWLQGKSIGRVRFDCSLKICNDPVDLDRFKEIAGLFVGQPYSNTMIRRARERLAKTGFFSSVTIKKSVQQHKVLLEIYAKGAVLIRKIDFRGIEPPPFREDLRKVLIYREGQPYVVDANKAQIQLESMRSLYEREGFFKTRIQMVVERDLEQEGIVDLVFVIKRGKELRICAVAFRGIRALNYAQARELILGDHGVITRRADELTGESIKSVLQKHVGITIPAYTEQHIKTGTRALIKEYRKRGYLQARVLHKHVKFGHPDTVEVQGFRPSQGCVALLFDISEGPRWRMEFVGNKTLGVQELKASLPFYETGYVDDEALQRGANSIARLYATRGYTFARVEVREERRDRFDRRIIFTIDEQRQVEIRSIIFHRSTTKNTPPHKLADKDLLDLMGTRPFGLFDTGGYLQYEELLSDMSKIEAAYQKHGYLRAQVPSFRLEMIEDGRAIVLHIQIDEGKRTKVSKLHVEGNRRLADGLIRSFVQVKPGAPDGFVPLSLRADTSRIIQRYASVGYPMAHIEAQCFLLNGTRVPCEAPSIEPSCLAREQMDLELGMGKDRLKTPAPMCVWDDLKKRTRQVCHRIAPNCALKGGVMRDEVRILHRIIEGPFVRVGEILLKGNFVTSSELIYPELPLKTGDVFHVQKLLEGQANLRSLDLFDSVSIEAIGLDQIAQTQREATAAIIISVEESGYQTYDMSFGLQGRDLTTTNGRLLLLGEFDYKNRNLFGLGQRFTPRLLFAGDLGQMWDVLGGGNVQRELESVEYLIGAELVYSDPRFLKIMWGIDKLLLTLSQYYILDQIGVLNPNLLREELGLRAELRKELVEFVDRLFVTMGLEAKWISTFEVGSGPVIDGQRLFSPRRTVGKLYSEIVFDRRDSPLNPTQGYYLSISPQWVSGDALGDRPGDAFLDSFFRITGAISFYVELVHTVVLGQSFRYGHILPAASRTRPVPADERYILGGVGSVRGFPDAGFVDNYTSVGNQLRGGQFMLNYNAEVRYPLFKQSGIFAATFFDAGLLADCFDDLENNRAVGCYEDAFLAQDPYSKIRLSAGMGLRYLLVDQIPLLLDYAMLLNRKPGESFGNLHFNVGYTF